MITRWVQLSGTKQRPSIVPDRCFISISRHLYCFPSQDSMSIPAELFLNIAKGTTDPRVEFISQVQTQILIKFHLKNLDQASTSKSEPNISISNNSNFKILTKPTFKISTKIQLHNLNRTSATKC